MMMRRRSQNPYVTLERAVDREDRADAIAALAITKSTDHEKDLLVDCPAKACRAAEREECRGAGEGKVHFGRRLKRLLGDIR